MIKRIAALYVHPNGPYYGHEQIDPWGLPYLDAREYTGPYPVIAHPPCARWSQLAGLTEKMYGLKIGADGGCFKHALWAVRRFGGVLEHPAYTKAYAQYGLIGPPTKGGWIKSDAFGYSCCVHQVMYGHKARKSTWLYCVNTIRPKLIWGYDQALIKAFVSNCDGRYGKIKRLGKKDSEVTPKLFFDLLVDLAQSCYESEGL
jgi:hypothetical protein